MLDGLPFRDEVPGGRDLRGNGWVNGRDMDFSNTDFSFSPTIGNFFSCKLENARFDELETETQSLGNVLNGSSFRKAKLRRCYFKGPVQHCCFEGANLRGADFLGSDLSGSSFVGANCKMAAYSGANLLGCDFRGANLDEAAFRDNQIDKSTDFRGASLINVYHDDDFDKAGNLRRHGVDLRQATFDETTKFGTDPLTDSIEYWDAIMEWARQRYGDDGAKIAAALAPIKERQVRAGVYSMSWQDELLSQLNEPQRKLYEQIADEANREIR